MIAINRRTLLTSLAAAGLFRDRAFAQAPRYATLSSEQKARFNSMQQVASP